MRDDRTVGNAGRIPAESRIFNRQEWRQDMALVVGVHGIGQQNSDPERQRTVWYDSLRLGASAAPVVRAMSS